MTGAKDIDTEGKDLKVFSSTYSLTNLIFNKLFNRIYYYYNCDLIVPIVID